jgi:hypothetical protein
VSAAGQGTMELLEQMTDAELFNSMAAAQAI